MKKGFVMNTDQTKILIIDDSQDVLTALEVIFRKANCQVFTAFSGEDGLTLAQQHNFNVILIDLVMPGLRGDETLILMKKIHPSTPIIMITGYDDIDKAKKCMLLGAYDYVQKPFDMEYLKTSVLSTAMLV